MAVQVLSIVTGALNTKGQPTTLYTSPAGITTIVKSIRLVNKDAAPRTVNLYITRAQLVPAPTNPPQDILPRHITPIDMVIPAGGLAIDDQEITMSQNDSISADVSNVNGVNIDFYISGIQR